MVLHAGHRDDKAKIHIVMIAHCLASIEQIGGGHTPAPKNEFTKRHASRLESQGQAPRAEPKPNNTAEDPIPQASKPHRKVSKAKTLHSTARFPKVQPCSRDHCSSARSVGLLELLLQEQVEHLPLFALMRPLRLAQ